MDGRKGERERESERWMGLDRKFKLPLLGGLEHQSLETTENNSFNFDPAISFADI